MGDKGGKEDSKEDTKKKVATDIFIHYNQRVVGLKKQRQGVG